MTDIAELGIRIDSAQAAKGASDLDKLTAAGARAEDQIQDLGVSSRVAGASVRGLAGGMAGLAGNTRGIALQLSQVAQQTAATGNFVQALAIQLPDMALGFGSVGIAAGVLASVALPVLMSAFADTGSRAEELKDTLDNMQSAVTAYSKAAQAAVAPNDNLAESYGRLAGVARQALDSIADVERINAINAVAAAIQGVSDSLLTYYATQGGGRAAGSRLGLVDDFGLAAEQAQKLVDALKALQSADGLEAQAVAAVKVQNALLAAYGSVDAMPGPLREAFTQMANIATAASKAQATTETLQFSFRDVGNAALAAAQFATQIGAAAQGSIGQVQALAKAMLAAAQAQLQLQKDAALNYGKIQNTGESGADAARRSVMGLNAINTVPVLGGGAAGAFKAVGGGGGGGGVSDDFQARLKALQDGLMTEREVVDAWYQDAQKVLADRRAQEALGEQGHRDAMLQIERSYQEQLAAIQAESQQTRISQMGGFFGALADIASAGGKRMVKTVAAFQAVEGVVNAYGAAIKALNTPGLTIWGRFAAYASVLGAGLKGVAAIRAAGGIGGGSAVPAAQAAPVQQGPAQVTVIQGLRKDELYSGQAIFDMLMQENKLRGNVFQVIR